MRCAATNRQGSQCKHSALDGKSLCATHQRRQEAADADSFYARLEGAELHALAAASLLDGVDAEIAVLRVLIRRLTTAGDVAKALRAIDALGRLARTRHELTKGTDTLSPTIERVLDTLGQELKDTL